MYVRSEEIDVIIDKLQEIEERFWINFREYKKNDRSLIEKNFDKIYEKLDVITNKDGVQESFIKEE